MVVAEEMAAVEAAVEVVAAEVVAAEVEVEVEVGVEVYRRRQRFPPFRSPDISTAGSGYPWCGGN